MSMHKKTDGMMMISLQQLTVYISDVMLLSVLIFPSNTSFPKDTELKAVRCYIVLSVKSIRVKSLCGPVEDESVGSENIHILSCWLAVAKEMCVEKH